MNAGANSKWQSTYQLDSLDKRGCHVGSHAVSPDQSSFSPLAAVSIKGNSLGFKSRKGRKRQKNGRGKAYFTTQTLEESDSRKGATANLCGQRIVIDGKTAVPLPLPQLRNKEQGSVFNRLAQCLKPTARLVGLDYAVCYRGPLLFSAVSEDSMEICKQEATKINKQIFA